MPTPLTAHNSTSYRATTVNTMYKVEDGLLFQEIPPSPEYFSDEAVFWWDYYCTLLIQGKCLSRFFITAITNLCLMHEVRECLVHELQTQGFMIDKPSVTADGHYTTTSVLNPLARDLQDCMIKMSKLLADMGMTAYTAKVNNIDTKGTLTQPTKSKPPTVAFHPQESPPAP